MNSTTLSAVTRINISHTSGARDFRAVLSPWSGNIGISHDLGSIRVFRHGENDTWAIFRITGESSDNTTYSTFFNVQFVAAGGTAFVNGNNDFVFHFEQAGGLSAAVDAISTQVAAGLVSAGPIRRILAGDQIVTGTAPVSISGLTFTVSGGVAYRFEFGIFTSAPISLAGNKFVLSSPGPIAGRYQLGGGGQATTDFATTNVTIAQVTVNQVGAVRANFVQGTFRPTANGTMAMAMGNAISGGAAGSSITIMAGSYGYVWRMG